MLTVARIFFASSIAMSGVGEPTLSLRQANTKAPTVSANSTPVTIANPTQIDPAESVRMASRPQAIVETICGGLEG